MNNIPDLNNVNNNQGMNNNQTMNNNQVMNNNQGMNNSYQYNPNMLNFNNANNLEHAIKTIDNLSLKETRLDDESSNNPHYNEKLIQSITDEISHRLGTDKNLINNKDQKKDNTQIKKTKQEKQIKQGKQEKDHMTNTDNKNDQLDIIDKIINYNDIKDFGILIIIFFLLSQDMIKDFFAEYISCINPDDEGKFNVKGVIVYGIILSILFIVVRKFI